MVPILYCKGVGILLLLKPPRTTHRIQTCDVLNFITMSGLLKTAKIVLFNSCLIILSPCGDPMKVTYNTHAKMDYHDAPKLMRVPYEKGFSKINNICAWGDGKPGKRETGIGLVPFKRSVEWQLVEEEAHAKAAAEKAGVGVVFNPLTMAQAGHIQASHRGPRMHSGCLWDGGILNKDPQIAKVAAAEERPRARNQEAADATARVQGSSRWLEKYGKATVEGPAAMLRLESECGGEIHKLRVTELEAIIIWKTKARVAADIKEATGEATQKKALVAKVKTLLINVMQVCYRCPRRQCM